MIYLDTSVALAQLLAEDRGPPEGLWQEPLISSRLIEYEIWTRIHARKLARSHGDEVRTLLGRIALVELSLPVLARALEPFPKPVRTLDALHLASMDFVWKQGQSITLASYDVGRSPRPALCAFQFTRCKLPRFIIFEIQLVAPR